MSSEEARLALSAILRPVTPGILKNIVAEAAKTSGSSPQDLGTYEALMAQMTPAVLDVVAADDVTRSRALQALTLRELEDLHVPDIPPVARVGLLEIGIRLGRAEVVAAAQGRPDGAAIIREFDTFATQLRAATMFGLRSERKQPR